MEKTFLKELKQNLEKEKAIIEKELGKFAKKDEKTPGDWDTRFPHWNSSSGSSALEEAADEVEEYSTLLPIEYSLETKLKNVNSALEKIKEGKYGKCEKCNKKISEKRLKVCPEARACGDCK